MVMWCVESSITYIKLTNNMHSTMDLVEDALTSNQETSTVRNATDALGLAGSTHDGGEDEESEDNDENQPEAAMGGSDSDEYVPVQDRNDSLYTDKGKEPAAAPQNCEHSHY
jgi:hypothetical protein